jgi:hypothetical protein
MAAGLLAGIMIYRRFSHENQTVITHILQKGATDVTEGGVTGCGMPAAEASSPACEGCVLR